MTLAALPWLAMLATVLVAGVVFGALVHRVSGGRALAPVLMFVACAPSAYLALTQAGWVTDQYLRFVRLWAIPLCTLSSAYLLYRSVAFRNGDRPVRRALREVTTVLLAWTLGLAVAGVELGRPLDRLALLVLVDRSRSIDLVTDADSRIEKELRVAELGMREGDRLGVVGFGASAVLESPLRTRRQTPTPQDIRIGRDATDLEQAIRRALAELPADARGRLVLLSDGVATRGDAQNGVHSALAAGVPIDVVPLDQAPLPNVRVVSLSAPTVVSEGETFNLRGVIESTSKGSIDVRVLLDGELLLEREVVVEEGQDVLDLSQRAQSSGLKRYELQITAKAAGRDSLTDDNRRSTFVRIRGPSAALLLSRDASTRTALGEALASAELQVTTADLYHIPQDVSELAHFDLVALVDVPAHQLTPNQLRAMEAYVRHLGGGILLMGSDQTLGPGGYGKTPVEAISPVSFDLKQDRRRTSLAEVIAIDYSGSMSARAGAHTKLELANEAAVRSAELLSREDQLGVMHVDSEVRWTRPLAPLDDPRAIATAIRGVGPGGGGIFVDISLREAYGALYGAKTHLKHVLLFADGADAEQMDGVFALAKTALSSNITTSVVSLGQGQDVPRLEQLSRAGGGRFYLIEDAQRLPAVFAQETILAARSALNEVSFRPVPRATSATLRGIDFDAAPPLHGYVVTIPKPRAQVLLDGPERDPILATWSVGVGKSGVFTSDYGRRWGKDWTRWPGASQLFAQLGRSLVRDQDDRKIRLKSEARGGHLVVSADVVDDLGALDSYRKFAVHVAGPGDFLYTLPLTAAGPGRYEASLPLERPGPYLVSAVELSTGKLVASSGAELSTSDELRPTGTDRATLERLARESNGVVRDTLAGIFTERLGARFAYDDVTTPLLWLAACLLLAMVTFRRLSVPAWLLPGKPKPATSSEPAAELPTLSRVLQNQRSLRRQRKEPDVAAAPIDLPPPRTEPPEVRSAAAASAPVAPSAPPPTMAGERKPSAAEILLARRRGRR